MPKCLVADHNCFTLDCPGQSNPSICHRAGEIIAQAQLQKAQRIIWHNETHPPARADDRPDPPASPTLDRPEDLDRELVVARYQEDVTWTAQAPCHVTIYNKGEPLPPPRQSATVIRLHNRGREGRTWLSHILRYWDSLAEWTFFAQGEPHQEPAEFLRRLDLAYSDTTPLTSQYKPTFPCDRIKATDVVADRDGLPIRWGRAIHQGGRDWPMNNEWLARVWPRFFACPIPDPLSDWVYGYGAMYAVPRHRILARPKRYWRYLWQQIDNHENQGEHAPMSGYAFEIVWGYLFGDSLQCPEVEPPFDQDRIQLAAEACPHGDGSCGCGTGPPRICQHPLWGGPKRQTDCFECVLRTGEA